MIEKIKAEIERRIALYKKSNYGISIRSDECKELLDFIESLDKEQLNKVIEEVTNDGSFTLEPQGLDEAAEKAGWEWACKNKLDPYSMGQAYSEGHKAGVKWMAEQGVVADFEVNKLAARAWLTAADEDKFQKDIYDNFEAGDKVIVQIRKKDGKD